VNIWELPVDCGCVHSLHSLLSVPGSYFWELCVCVFILSPLTVLGVVSSSVSAMFQSVLSHNSAYL